MRDTRGSLLRRRRALLALTVAATTALFAAYHLVHRDAAPLRDDTATAIMEVTAAQNALIEAGATATEGGDLAPSALVDTGGDYRVQIAAANQSIARAAEASVRGESGLRELETVTGLIVSYAGWLERADRMPRDSTLRAGYVFYADHTLTGQGDGILDRLDDLQQEQYEVLGEQASFGRPAQIASVAALSLCAALVLLLAEAQFFLWRRCRRRVNPALLGATALLLLALAGLGRVTEQTDTAMATAQDRLVDELVDPWTARGDFGGTVNPEKVSDSIRDTAERVHDDMGRTDRWDGLTGIVPVLGLLLAALTALGLWRPIDQYRFRGAA